MPITTFSEQGDTVCVNGTPGITVSTHLSAKYFTFESQVCVHSGDVEDAKLVEPTAIYLIDA